MESILLGFMTCAWFGTIGLGVYLSWRFKAMWQVLRKDIVTLNEIQGQLRKDIGLRKALSPDDASLTRFERAARVRAFLPEESYATEEE